MNPARRWAFLSLSIDPYRNLEGYRIIDFPHPKKLFPSFAVFGKTGFKKQTMGLKKSIMNFSDDNSEKSEIQVNFKNALEMSVIGFIGIF